METKVHMRNKLSKSATWQAGDNKRQASRLGFERSLVREIWKIKSVTNDDVFFAYRKSEKTEGEVNRFTTSKEFNFETNTGANISITSGDSSVIDPGALATFSPSAGNARTTPTARAGTAKKAKKQ